MASKGVLRDLGSISPTYFHTAFTPVAPKSVRIQSSCQYLFTLLGSTGAKAAQVVHYFVVRIQSEIVFL